MSHIQQFLKDPFPECSIFKDLFGKRMIRAFHLKHFHGPQSLCRQIYDANLQGIKFLSFISWSFATQQHRLVDESPDAQTITAMKIRALIEPTCALAMIGIALFSPVWSDLAWLTFPLVYCVLKKIFGVSQNTHSKQTRHFPV